MQLSLLSCYSSYVHPFFFVLFPIFKIFTACRYEGLLRESLLRSMAFLDSVKASWELWTIVGIIWVASCIMLERLQVIALASARAQEARRFALGISAFKGDQ
jgi:hypothetical protein